MLTDEMLMLDFQRGSTEAFEELFARYRDLLYGFFRRRLESPGRAEDLAQETFLAAFRATARYEPRALVRTYLFGIAFKLLFAERRKQAKEVQSPQSPPERSARAAVDEVLWVRQALEKVDAADREILMLREYEQLTYAEIAELLRLPINTVRSRLFRARLLLKSYLVPDGEETRVTDDER